MKALVVVTCAAILAAIGYAGYREYLRTSAESAEADEAERALLEQCNKVMGVTPKIDAPGMIDTVWLTEASCRKFFPDRDWTASE